MSIGRLEEPMWNVYVWQRSHYLVRGLSEGEAERRALEIHARGPQNTTVVARASVVPTKRRRKVRNK